MSIAPLGHILDSNTEALWSLDDAQGAGTFVDASSNANALNIHNNPASVAGIVAARKFNGTSQYADRVGASQTVTDLTGALTVESWVTLDPTWAAQGCVIGYLGADTGTLSNRAVFQLVIEADRSVTFRYHGNNGGTLVDCKAQTSTEIIPLDTKTHISGKKTVNGGSWDVSVQINGVTVVTNTYAYSFSGGSASGWIMAAARDSGNNPTNYFNGTIDDTRISKISRTQSETEQSYRRGFDARAQAIIQSPTQFDVSSSVVITTGSTRARSLASRLTAPKIDVRDFGVVGDGVTANDFALLLLGNFIIANPGSEVVFPPGEYVYEDNLWPSGLPAHFKGYGAKLRCTRSYTYGDYPPGAIRAGADIWGYPSVPTGNEIATVEQNTNVLTCLVGGYAANFNIGDYVLVYGYNAYAGGWPPSFRFKEWHKVKAVDGGANTITLWRKLKHRFRQDWREYLSGRGVARVLNLSTLSTTYVPFGGRRRPCASQSWEGFEFPINSNESHYPYMSQGPWGLVTVGGEIDSCRLINCKTGFFVAGDMNRLEVLGCDMEMVELDKTSGSARFENCVLGTLQGGTTWDRIVLQRCEISILSAMSIDSFAIEDCDIWNLTDAGVAANFSAKHTVARHNRLHNKPGVVSAFSYGPAYTGSAVVSGAVAPTRSKVYFDVTGNEPMGTASTGTVAQCVATGVWGVIEDIYYDTGTGKCVMEFSPALTVVPTAGDSFLFTWVAKTFFDDNLDVTSGTLQAYEVAEPTYVITPGLTQRSADGFVRQVLTLPHEDGVAVGCEIPRTMGKAYLRRVEVNIVVAGLADKLLQIYPSAGPYWAPQVNVGYVGTRIFEVGRLSGIQNQTGEGGTPIPPEFASSSQMNLTLVGATGAPHARGFIVLEWYVSPV